MTRMTIEIEDADPATLAKISKMLGVSPKNIKVSAVSQRSSPSNGDGGQDWTSETARMLVEGLKTRAFTVLSLLCEHDGVVSLDACMEALELDDGKALGGVMSSVGHNISRLVDQGLLPEGTTIMVRDEETREFRATVSRRVLGLLSTAVNRRARTSMTAVA